MAEILLMRHGKSGYPAGVPDRDRPLSGRGERSASAIGRAISDFAASPDLVLTSPARRARDTAALAHAAGGWVCEIGVVEDLYGGGVADAVSAANAADAARVLLVGHEPTWSTATAFLIGGGSIQMVTASVVCIESAVPAGRASGWLRWMLHPRLLVDR
jgi:phosphohistidine phosphatase